MLGLSDKTWLLDLLQGAATAPATSKGNPTTSTYDAYFGLGHCLQLADDVRVFKVSLAGMALGACLTRLLRQADLAGRFLDLGTGSGALAILLRSLGAADITASDIVPQAVTLAAENELRNFPDAAIRFIQSDLFDGLGSGSDRFDTIVFNPPGWRAPSDAFIRQLESLGDASMAPASMFYGDSTLLRFLLELPDRLNAGGRAIIGLNSLVGIQDVLTRYRTACNGAPPLSFRLIERHTFPLLFYSEAWRQLRVGLQAEFRRWREQDRAAYTADSHGNLYWSYELIECRMGNDGHPE